MAPHEETTLNTEIIKASWNAMAGQRMEFVEAFYARLFESYPQYRAMFPQDLGPQRERMIEMIGSLAQFADHVDLLQPYLGHVGFQHRRTGIRAADVENFKQVFLDTLPAAQDATARQAWEEAFDEVIIPLFDEGLERGRDAL